MTTRKRPPPGQEFLEALTKDPFRKDADALFHGIVREVGELESKTLPDGAKPDGFRAFCKQIAKVIFSDDEVAAVRTVCFRMVGDLCKFLTMQRLSQKLNVEDLSTEELEKTATEYFEKRARVLAARRRESRREGAYAKKKPDATLRRPEAGLAETKEVQEADNTLPGNNEGALP